MSKSVSEDSRRVTPKAGSQAGWLAGLRQRLLSAGVLIPIAIALVWFGGWIAFGGAVVALALGMWELRTMFAAHRKWYPLVLFSGAGIVEGRDPLRAAATDRLAASDLAWTYREVEIGRASCRERV